MYSKINFTISSVLVVLAVFSVAIPISALELSNPPTLKEVLEAVKEYNESVSKDLEITINFSHPDYPIVIPRDKLLNSGEEIETFVEQTHINEEGMKNFLEDGKEKSNDEYGPIVGKEEEMPDTEQNRENKEEQQKEGKKEDNNKEDKEWTQEDFDNKYENSLPDDGTLDHD